MPQIRSTPAVSTTAKAILKSVAAGTEDPDKLNLNGGRRRTLTSLQRGKLLRTRIEKVERLELTAAGRRLLEGNGSSSGKSASTSRGRGKVEESKRGRPLDESSARALAAPIIARFKGRRRDLIQKLVTELKRKRRPIKESSASTMIYEAGWTSSLT